MLINMRKIFLLAILLLPSVTFAQSFPDFPMSFWGTVTVDGVNAPAGAVVRVYADTEKLGEAAVQAGGVYGYTEPMKQKLVVAEGEGALTFTIQATGINGGVETQGLTPITYSGFDSGETVNKNLAFKITNTQPSSGGSSGGGGGGGGSKKKNVATEQPLVLGSATSTLSEVEQRIVMQKQIIALLTQLIQLLTLKLAL